MAGNVIQLTIRVDNKGKPVVETFVNDTKKGMTEVEKSSTGASTALGNLKKAAGTALTALAAVGGAALTAATSGLALARNAAQAGDQAYVLGQQLGISAEKASELDYWARSNSSSTEAMTAAMRALALSASQAAAGSKQDVAAFKAIGLTVDQVNPSLHSMDEIFRTVVGAMDRYAESGNKTAAGTVILGRGFTELKPALAGGVQGMDDAARAGRVLGVIFTDEAASAAHELNNSFDDLRAAVRGVTNAVGIDLFPMVKQAVSETTEWIKKNKDLIATKVERFITAVVEAGKILGPIIRGAAAATLELLDRLTKVNPELLQFAAGTAAVVGGASLATSGLQSFVETGTKVVDTSLNIVANFKAINANSMLAKAGLTSLSVAGFTAVASAGALLVLKIQELNKELGELADQSSKYLAGIQAMNPELRTLTMTQAGFQQALSKSKEELQAVEAKIEKLNSQTFSDVTESSAELEAEAARLREQITHQTAALDKATQKLQDYGKGQKKAAALTVEVADATLTGVSAHKENVGAMDASGDAAVQTAAKFSQLRDAAAQASAAALSAAVQQGDSDAVYAALGKALRDVVLSYNAEIAAADASGESAANVALAHEAAGDRAKAAVDALVKTVVDGAQKQTEALRQLDDQIGQSKLALLSQDLENLSEDWGQLSTEQRQAELPQALDLLEQKYQLLIAAAERAAEAQHHAGESAGEAARIDERLALEKEQLNGELEKEKKAWRDAADGAKTYVTFARAVEDELDKLSGDLSNLATALLTGQVSWKDAGRAVAGMFIRGFEDILASQLQPMIDGVLKGAVSMIGSTLGGLFSGAGSSLATGLGSSLVSGIEGAFGLASGAIAAAAPWLGLGAAVVGGSVWALTSPHVSESVKNATAGMLTFSVLSGIEAAALTPLGALILAPINALVGAVVGGILSAFGIQAGPDKSERIAIVIGNMIAKSFRNEDVARAVQEGAQAIGDSVGSSMVKAMTHIPVSEIHKGIHDVVTESFAGESEAVTTEIQQLAQAAGTAVSAQMGYVGSQAIAFSQAWAGAWIRAQVDAGKSAQQIIKELEAMDKALGTSGGIFAALDELNAKIIETGKSGEVFKDLSATVKDWTGKKSDIQSFSDVLAAFGGDAVLTLNAIKKSLEDNGIAIEQFGNDLGDVVLAFTGAGESIQAATEDYRKFGNEADGTGEILRQKVLSGLDDVIASAKDFPVESVDAFRSAVAMIPPEMLRSSEFTNALREDFARMAAESHMSVQELVDSFDPPLEQAVRDSILAVNDLGKAIGDLAGAPLRSLKEVTDRMKQFSGELYVWVEENGKQVQKLTTFGEQVVGDVVSAVSGMWNTINEDSWVGLDEVGKAFAELGNIPAEALNDPAIQSAMKSLFAKLGEALGDAELIAMANADVITSDMIAEATKRYDDYVDHIADNPPEVPSPTTPDGQPATSPDGQPTGPDTSAATSAPPPSPVPADTLQSWADLTEQANAFGAAAKLNTEAVHALAEATKVDSVTILAAIQPIIGTVGDGRSLIDLNDLFGVRLPQSVTDLTDLVIGKTGNMADSFDKVRGAVNQLTTSISVDLAGAITGLPDGDVTITTHYVNDGSPETGGGAGGDGSDGKAHTGAIVPGYPSTTERLYKVLPGEVLIPPDHDLSAAIRAAGSIESGIANYTAGRAPGRGVSAGTPSDFPDGGGGRAVGDVAGEVVSRLTQGGAIAYVPISRATMRDIADGVAEIVVLDKLPRLSAAGAVKADPRTGVIKRSSTIPGLG